MKIKSIVAIAIISSGMMFQSCEQDQLQNPSKTPSVNTEKVKEVVKQNKNGLYTEAELEEYIGLMAEESAITVTEVENDQYSITTMTFNDGNITDPPNPNSVWPNNAWGRTEARREILQLTEGGGCVTVDYKYGLIAVNAC